MLWIIISYQLYQITWLKAESEMAPSQGLIQGTVSASGKPQIQASANIFSINFIQEHKPTWNWSD